MNIGAIPLDTLRLGERILALSGNGCCLWVSRRGLAIVDQEMTLLRDGEWVFGDIPTGATFAACSDHVFLSTTADASSNSVNMAVFQLTVGIDATILGLTHSSNLQDRIWKNCREVQNEPPT